MDWGASWLWFAIALVLGILEMVLPGFILLGFAIGAGVVGLVLLTGISVGLPMLLLVFAAVSLAAWLGLRRMFRLKTGQVKTFDHDINS